MIILLNGPSSAGKSSIAREIQAIAPRPFFTFGLDEFIDMMPISYFGFAQHARQGFYFVESTDTHGHPLITIYNGPYGDKIIDALPKVAQLFAQLGFDLVLDEVLYEDHALRGYVKALARYTVYFVGVTCSAEELDRRERMRGDRHLGIARGQIHRVHGPTREYDILIDTTHSDPRSSAEKILAFCASEKNPQGFKKLEKIFNDS